MEVLLNQYSFTLQEGVNLRYLMFRSHMHSRKRLNVCIKNQNLGLVTRTFIDKQNGTTEYHTIVCCREKKYQASDHL